MDTQTADRILVALARLGDKAAFSCLVERHRPMLELLCRRALRDRSVLVDDAVQEACLRALLALETLQHPGRFGAWLAGIGLNVCRGWLTRSGREAGSWEALLEGGVLGVDLPAHEPGPEEMAEAADVARRVRHAIAALPPAQHTAASTWRD